MVTSLFREVPLLNLTANLTFCMACQKANVPSQGL